MLKRIALIAPSLRGGGVERMRLHLAEWFIAQGLDVDLVLVQAHGPYMKDVPQGVRVVDLRSARTATSIPKLAGYLRNSRPEAILAALPHIGQATIIARFLARLHMPVVVSFHNTENVRGSPRIDNRMGSRGLSRALQSRILRQAESVVAVSQGVADNITQQYGLARSKMNVIYNPVITPKLYSLAEQLPSHPWFQRQDREAKIVLGVGRLTAQKDFGTLIHAFANVPKIHNARLIILGEGELRPELEQLIRDLGIEDSVSLPGFQHNPYTYMKRASLFVLSSIYEGLGNVLVEALAVGTSVISTDCPSGPAEILKGGAYGSLVPIADSEAMTRAITLALERTGDHETQPAFNPTPYSIDFVGEQYLELLKSGTR